MFYYMAFRSLQCRVLGYRGFGMGSRTLNSAPAVGWNRGVQPASKHSPMLPYVVVPSMLGVDLNLGKKSVKSEGHLSRESPIEVVQKTQNTIQSTGSGEI